MAEMDLGDGHRVAEVHLGPGFVGSQDHARRRQPHRLELLWPHGIGHDRDALELGELGNQACGDALAQIHGRRLPDSELVAFEAHPHGRRLQ